MSIVLVDYRAPKNSAHGSGDTHCAVYTARLSGDRIVFSGGPSSHSVSAYAPLRDVNAHWVGYVQNLVGRTTASPKRITGKALLAAVETQRETTGRVI